VLCGIVLRVQLCLRVVGQSLKLTLNILQINGKIDKQIVIGQAAIKKSSLNSLQPFIESKSMPHKYLINKYAIKLPSAQIAINIKN
jgi:hypothetical protein